MSTGLTTANSWSYADGNIGAETGSYRPRFRFSSKEYDAATGFYHFPYRCYAPEWGRWITKDPLDGSSDVDLIRSRAGANSYAFVRNNPLRHVDPEGLYEFKVHGKYCGPGWCSGQWMDECNCTKLKNPKPPEDPVDACCKDHDICTGTAKGKSGLQACDKTMCKCLQEVDPSELTPSAREARTKMLGLFCGGGVPGH